MLRLLSGGDREQTVITLAAANQRAAVSAQQLPPVQNPGNVLVPPTPLPMPVSPMPDRPVIRVIPFSVTRPLFPESDQNQTLSVSVDRNGNATVRWTAPSTNQTVTYQGLFDPKTQKIVIQSSTGVISQVQVSFQKIPGNMYALSVFEVVYRGGNISTDSAGIASSVLPHIEKYTYSPDGFLQTRESHFNAGDGSYNYMTSYGYGWVGNKKLLQSVSYNDTVLSNGVLTRFSGKKFFNYDSNGNRTVSVWAYTYIDAAGHWKCRAGYELTDKQADTRTSVTVEGLALTVYASITSWRSYPLISGFAVTRRIDYKKLPDGSYRYYVDEVKNAAGVFVPKMVAERTSGQIVKTWIIQGKADILSTEHDDILVKPSQDVNGYHVFYGSRNNQYGLIFEKAAVRISIDYPTQKTVTLDGKIYDITIDALGVVILKQKLSPVERYAEQLQQQVGGGFTVALSPWRGGGYTILVTNNTVTSSGLKEMRLFLDDAGQLNDHFIVPVYDHAAGPVTLTTGQAWILFEGMKLIKSGATELEALAMMTQVQLESVNNGTPASANSVSFQYQGKTYKAFENNAGKVVLSTAVSETRFATTDDIRVRLFDDGSYVVRIDGKDYPSDAQGMFSPDGNNNQARVRAVFNGQGLLTSASEYRVMPDGTLKLEVVYAFDTANGISRVVKFEMDQNLDGIMEYTQMWNYGSKSTSIVSGAPVLNTTIFYTSDIRMEDYFSFQSGEDRMIFSSGAHAIALSKKFATLFYETGTDDRKGGLEHRAADGSRYLLKPVGGWEVTEAQLGALQDRTTAGLQTLLTHNELVKLQETGTLTVGGQALSWRAYRGRLLFEWPGFSARAEMDMQGNVYVDLALSGQTKRYAVAIDPQGIVTLTLQLPPVERYAEQLQQQVGGGFTVALSPWRGGGYTILVTNNTVTSSGLKEMRLFLDDAGQLNDHFIVPVYDHAAGPVTLTTGQAWILFEGMKLIKSGATELEALAMMTQVQLESVNNGTPASANSVSFQYQGKTYKAFENSSGIVVLLTVAAQYQVVAGDVHAIVKLYEDGSYDAIKGGVTYPSDGSGIITTEGGMKLKISFSGNQLVSLATLNAQLQNKDVAFFTTSNRISLITQIRHLEQGQVTSLQNFDYANKSIETLFPDAAHPEVIHDRWMVFLNSDIDPGSYISIDNGAIQGFSPGSDQEKDMFVYFAYTDGVLRGLVHWANPYAPGSYYSVLANGALDVTEAGIRGLTQRTTASLAGLLVDDRLVQCGGSVTASDGVKFFNVGISASFQLTLDLLDGTRLTAVNEANGLMTLSVPHSNGTIKVYEVTLDAQGIVTLTFRPAVPEGWTRTASNVNYGFRNREVYDFYNNQYRDVLEFQDLRTGVVRILSEDVRLFVAQVTLRVCDVSSDGVNVIYGKKDALVVERVQSSWMKRVISGNLQSIRFEGNTAVLGVQIDGQSPECHLNLSSFEYTLDAQWEYLRPLLDGYKRTSGNPNFASRVDEESSVGFTNYTLRIMNLASMTVQDIVSVQSPQRVSLGDIDPAGTAVIYTISQNSVLGYVFNVQIKSLSGSGFLNFSGSISGSIVYEPDDTVLIPLRSVSGSFSVVRVDLKDFSILSYDGWMPAVSNSGFMFKNNGQTLFLRDLSSGNDISLASFDGIVIQPAPVYDVSPSGSAVIYGLNSANIYVTSTIVIRDPRLSSRSLTLPGKLRSISWNGNIAAITREVVGGLIETVLVDLTAFRIV